MVSLKKCLAMSSLLVIVVGAAACSTSDTSTTPTTPTTVTVLPAISSLTPASPIASTATQTLTVTGANFSSGLSLVMRNPDGASTVYSPSAISEQTATSFKAAVTLAVAGGWMASVRNNDGNESATMNFTVGAPATNPQINNVSPAVIVSDLSPQTVAIAGVNFRSGLSLLVRNSSTGETATYNGASLSGQTSTLFTAQVLFSAAGAYDLTVRNADGLQSGTFQVIVAATPLVTMVLPNNLTTSSSTQIFEVVGLHFLTGVGYILNGPGTGAVFHGSADVSELSVVHFKAVGLFAVAGDWTITVVNANGVQSAPFSFHVGP